MTCHGAENDKEGTGVGGGGEGRKVGGKDRRKGEKRRKQRRETAGIKPRGKSRRGGEKAEARPPYTPREPFLSDGLPQNCE